MSEKGEKEVSFRRDSPPVCPLALTRLYELLLITNTNILISGMQQM